MSGDATCEACGFVAKNDRGLAVHVRWKHPELQAPTSVTAAVRDATVGRSGPTVAAALRLAGMLDDGETSARDAAGLSRELRLLLAEIPEDEEPTSAIDQLAQRRRARTGDAAG